MVNNLYKINIFIFILLVLISNSCTDKDDISYEALFNSIRENKILILEAILDTKELDINYVDENLNTTALHEAVLYGDKKIVDLLVENGADVNIANGNKKTALMIAAENNNVDIISSLLNYGAYINAFDNRNYNALMYAVENGHYHASEFLFGMGIDVESVSIDNKRALDIASEKNYEPIVSLLTKHFSPLIDAIVSDNSEMALQIIESGEYLEVIDSNGITALIHATERGNIEIVNALLQSGKIDINRKDKSGATALSLAVQLGSIDIANLLLEYGAQTYTTSTPLIFKARTEQMVRLLGSYNIDVNVQYGDFLYTPLMVAAENSSIEMVMALIELGANPNMVNRDGLNAYMLAQKSGNISVALYLSELSEIKNY